MIHGESDVERTVAELRAVARGYWAAWAARCSTEA